MTTPLRVLLIEDSPADALLLLRELQRGGYEPTYQRVDTPETTEAALEGRTWDIVISDHSMPRFSATEALALVRARGLDLPFIIVSGVIDDEVAVEAMRGGANDYLRKDRLARLAAAIARELQETADRRERTRAEGALMVERLRAEVAERMTAEINHRMKNNLMLLVGVLQMQLASLAEGEAADALRDAVSRIIAISVIHEQLYRDQPGRVDLCDVLRRIGQTTAQILSVTHAEVSVSGPICYVSSKLGSTLAIVASELITNAIKYGEPDRDGRLHIAVELTRGTPSSLLGVWNSGQPVPEGFDVASQAGLGLTLVSSVVKDQLAGSFSLRRRGNGTLAEILLPDRALDSPDYDGR